MFHRLVQGTEPSEAEIKKLIRKGTIGGNFVPVLCGSAFKNKGVQVDIIVTLHLTPTTTSLTLTLTQHIALSLGLTRNNPTKRVHTQRFLSL